MIQRCEQCGSKEFGIDKQSLGYMVVYCRNCLHDAIMFERETCSINLEGFKAKSILNGLEESPVSAVR